MAETSGPTKMRHRWHNIMIWNMILVLTDTTKLVMQHHIIFNNLPRIVIIEYTRLILELNVILQLDFWNKVKCQIKRCIQMESNYLIKHTLQKLPISQKVLLLCFASLLFLHSDFSSLDSLHNCEMQSDN